MSTPSQEAALDLTPRFSLQLMQQYREDILFAINSFRSLDTIIDRDDLEQEAFFGLSSALRTWDEARAINMKFETFLVWHIKRHLQGIFLNSDMVVELIDPQTNVVVITLPYERYRKVGRRMAREKKYVTRIRSLKVYYEEDVERTGNAPTAVDPHRHAAISTMADTHDTYVIDLYKPNGAYIVTIPRSLYLKKFQLIQEKRLRAREWCIYDSPSDSIPPTTYPSTTCMHQVHRRCSTNRSEAIVVDIYTLQGEKFLRTTPAEYEGHKSEFRGYRVYYHNAAIYPEQPEFEEVEQSTPNAIPSSMPGKECLRSL